MGRGSRQENTALAVEPTRGMGDRFKRESPSPVKRPVTVRDLAVRMYTDEQNPKTIAEISRELGIGRETVREHLIRAGVPRRAQKARGSRDEQMIAEAAQRYNDGETLWEIANDLGKTATTVRAWLIEAGVERRRPGVSVDSASLAETIRQYESGKTIDEVASAQDLHPWTVRQRLVNANVPRRPRGRRAQPDAEPEGPTRVSDEAVSAQILRGQQISDRRDELFPYASQISDVFAPTMETADAAGPLDEEFIVGGTIDDMVLPSVGGTA